MRFAAKAFLILVGAPALWFCVPASAGTPPSHALFLCMHCQTMAGGRGDYADTYFEFQRANERRAVGIGDNHPWDTDELKAAAAAKIPIVGEGKSVYEQKLFESHLKGETETSNPKTVAKKNLLAAFKAMDRTKPIVIHLSNHGWNGDFSAEGTLPPEKAGLLIREQRFGENPKNLILTHEELGQLLVEAGLTGPDAPPVRIVAEHCYGGGVHWLSEKFPNVCSAAFSDYKTPNYYIDNEAGEFWKYTAREKEKGRKPSLLESFYAGWSVKDNESSRGGALSSTQFVKNVLKKKGIAAEEIGQWTDLDWSTWENYTTLEYDPIVKGKRALGLVDACKKDPYAIPPVTSAQVFADAEAALKILVPDGEGADVQEYRKAVADLRKNESSYRELRETHLKKLEEMRGRWKALNEEEKAEASREYLDSVGGFFDWVKGDFASNKKKRLDSIAKEKTEFLKEFAKFEKTNGAKLQTYFRNKEMVARFAELRAFTDAYVAGKVTEKEMSTYRRMLRCESIPL